MLSNELAQPESGEIEVSRFEECLHVLRAVEENWESLRVARENVDELMAERVSLAAGT